MNQSFLSGLEGMAGTTGLEPAASAVTGQRSNQLNYVPTLKTQDLAKSRAGSGFCVFRIRALFALLARKSGQFWRNRL